MFLLRKKYQIANIYNSIFKENFKKKLNFDWVKYPERHDIIKKIIEKKKYSSYLEIGCFEDETFNKINIDKKVGVDPNSGGNVRLTSDNFFKINKDRFDIIFIDGLHAFKQVKKDITNSLNILNKNGVLLLHDCLPQKIRDQASPRAHKHWNGDVWKAIVEFRTKEEFDTYTCYADQGIGIILKRKNRNKLDIKIDNFSKLKFSSFFKNYKEFMNIIEHHELKMLI